MYNSHTGLEHEAQRVSECETEKERELYLFFNHWLSAIAEWQKCLSSHGELSAIIKSLLQSFISFAFQYFYVCQYAQTATLEEFLGEFTSQKIKIESMF